MQQELGTNYIDRIAVAIGERCGLPFTETEPDLRVLLRLYAVLCLVSGEATTSENVHDAWSAWCVGIAPDHKSIKPFCDLAVAVQLLDETYRVAIVDTAKELRGQAPTM